MIPRAPTDYGFEHGEIIAWFGNARLIKRLGKRASTVYELIGGTPDDRTSAKEWISMFMHEAVLAQIPSDNASSSLSS
jgi:hypothetical protein